VYTGTTDGRADAGELRLAVDNVACCRRRWLADRRPIEKLDKPSTTGTGGDDGKVAFGRRRARRSPCCALDYMLKIYILIIICLHLNYQIQYL